MIASATRTISGPGELRDFATNLADNLAPEPHEATVVGLVGPLGVGKTALAGELLAAYGVEGPVTSPTYTIETVYWLPNGPFSHAYHLDTYRLDGSNDLEALDFERRLENPENLILIEWADKISDILTGKTLYIDMLFGEAEDERIIKTYYE
ncbi:MAG: tRNA (adenosine(37)-N6)-threonylcarbamoyltransferase complex ATPase subunit type 1 TsaE [Candidatus Paceibacterota bacterium]